MNQMKRFAQSKAFPYIAAFGLPFFICVIICIGNGVYPFGDNCILHIDMYHQYCPFFTEFLNKLQSGGSLQYSWNLGLGSDFVSLYAYYLASPLNFLILLCPKSHVIEFMTLLIILKISASGLTFFLYIRHHYKLVGKDGRMHKNQVIPAIVFSTAYALSGFVAAYSWDIMWMDCIALFPLIMIGLERLVQEKKADLYYITLALCIFCNYYISIMICIFLVFAFILLFFSQKKGKGGAVLRFGWYSLLAGASSAILLLPEIAVLSVSGSAEGGFPKTAEFYFNILAELGRGAAVTSVYTGNDHWPNLYAGAFSLFLVWIYVLNRRISWKEKVPRIAMLAFFLVSFAENQLDYIWHGMHFPQALPGRQSFLYSFVLLSMGFAAVRKRKGTKIWHIAVAAIVSMMLLLLAGWYGDETVTEPVSLVITALFICVYAVTFVLTKITGKKKRLAFAQFAVFVAVAELAINMAATGFGTTSRVAYTEKQTDYENLLETAKEDNEETGSGFYRVEDTERKTKNDDSLYGYASATIFSSLMNLDVSHLFQSLFMEGGKNFYCYNGATPLSSSLFSVKYMLSDSALEESPYRTLIGGSGRSFLYRNNYSLPLGFVMDEQAIANWTSSTADRMASLNSLTSALGAEGQMLYPATCVTDANAGDTTIDIAEDGYYYADYVSCTSDTLTVNRSDGWTKQYSKTSHRYLIELGECKAGDEIHILNSNMESIEFQVYQLNEKVVQQAFDTLNAQTMQLTDMTDRKIEGKIQVQNAGRLILSVPADEGWTLYVDGKETEIEPLADALVGVHLEKGSYTIKLCYTTPGLKVGAGISLGAVILFLISACVRTGISRKRELHE
ncbi:MAG: YfhO family protein [Agathobacter sp.]|nr:YfhO family protein [Lachnospiraceae bacterium]MDY2620299.1 YfhO family protein [Agathobacter sp.]